MSTKKVGQIFKRARLAKNLTQAEVALRAGISANTYARIERGIQSPNFSSVRNIARVLDININDLPA